MEIGVRAQRRDEVIVQHGREAHFVVVALAEHAKQVGQALDDRRLNAEDVAQNKPARLHLVLGLRCVLLVGAVECVEMHGFQL